MTVSGITATTYLSTPDVVQLILSTMAAESGTVSDFNIGSQIRSQTESVGLVVESQGVWTQQLCFQVLLFSALSAFGITPALASPASGIVNIQTASAGAGPPATQNVLVPSGALVATVGGFQYVNTADTLLAAGSSGVPISVLASVGGAAGNAAASAVQSVVSNLGYPVVAQNPNPMSGGVDAQTTAQTLARFTALRASIGKGSPGAIANAAWGVSFGSETVQYSAVYEPWAAAGAGSGSGVSNYTVLIDNGLGTASSGLLSAVQATLNGSEVSGITIGNSPDTGYRDAGVPYTVQAVTPTWATVGVTGVVNSLSNVSSVQSAMNTAISGFNTLQFNSTAFAALLNAAVANSAPGQLSSLTVALRASGSSTAVTGITPPVSGRVVIGAISLSLTQGT